MADTIEKIYCTDGRDNEEHKIEIKDKFFKNC